MELQRNDSKLELSSGVQIQRIAALKHEKANVEHEHTIMKAGIVRLKSVHDEHVAKFQNCLDELSDVKLKMEQCAQTQASTVRNLTAQIPDCRAIERG